MQHRPQRTIRQAVETSGVGFLTGADITVRFLPAGPNHGIAFQRTDCSGSPPIPARIEYTVPRRRRTAIEHGGVVVEMIEHIMAALAGLQIDNCLVQLNALEPPGYDGSSLPFVNALLEAGVVEQNALREQFVIQDHSRVCTDDGSSELTAQPSRRLTLTISYRLDYGPQSPILPQNLTVELVPDRFVSELAFSRTFVLESEVEALRAQGYGSRTTAKDLLVFGAGGVIQNRLRSADECVRHKILDCLGDLALIGCDLFGHFQAYRSGHTLNREMVRRLKIAQSNARVSSKRDAA